MPFNVPLRGLVEPSDPSWATVPTAERRAFYQRAGEVAVRELRAQLMRGIGATGAKMPARKRPRPDGAAGPVLNPHYAESRTARLLGFKAWADGVTLFWHGGVSKRQKLPWGTILGFHAAGRVRGAPARDVRAADRTIKRVRDEMGTWWDTRRRNKRGGGRGRGGPRPSERYQQYKQKYPRPGKAARPYVPSRPRAPVPPPTVPLPARPPNWWRRATGAVGRAAQRAWEGLKAFLGG